MRSENMSKSWNEIDALSQGTKKEEDSQVSKIVSRLPYDDSKKKCVQKN